MDRLIRGVEESANVCARQRRLEPATEIWLVPDDPVPNERVAPGRRRCERGELSAARRRKPGRTTPVGPARSADERDDRLDASRLQSAQLRVGEPPAEGAQRRLDLVPVECEPDHVDTEPIERVEPLREPSWAVEDPAVVLDA